MTGAVVIAGALAFALLSSMKVAQHSKLSAIGTQETAQVADPNFAVEATASDSNKWQSLPTNRQKAILREAAKPPVLVKKSFDETDVPRDAVEKLPQRERIIRLKDITMFHETLRSLLVAVRAALAHGVSVADYDGMLSVRFTLGDGRSASATFWRDTLNLRSIDVHRGGDSTRSWSVWTYQNGKVHRVMATHGDEGMEYYEDGSPFRYWKQEGKDVYEIRWSEQGEITIQG